MDRKSLTINAVWLLVAAGAFAAGSYFSGQPSGQAGGPQEESRSLITIRDSSASKANDAGTAATPAATAAAQAATFLDKYRVGATGGLNEKGMGDAVKEALRESDPVKSSLMFSMVLEELTADNAAAAFAAMQETVSGMDGMRYGSLLLFKWGAVDGAAAIAAAREEGGRGGPFASAMALSGWGSSNPDAALSWLAENTSDDERANEWMTRSLISGIAGTDPQRATELAMEMATQAPDSARGLAETIAREQLKGGVDKAEAWMNGLTDDNLRRGALETIGDHLANQDPETASAWAARYADQPGGDRVVSRVADEWAEKDPNAALNWVSTLADGDAKNNGMRDAVSEWSQQDPTAASEYLTTLPDSPSKDYAINGLVRTTSRDEPDSALAWAMTINNEELRNQTIVDTASWWLRRDEAAATTWLAGSGLSEDVAAKIVEQSQQRGPRGDWGGFQGGAPGGGFRGRGR